MLTYYSCVLKTGELQLSVRVDVLHLACLLASCFRVHRARSHLVEKRGAEGIGQKLFPRAASRSISMLRLSSHSVASYAGVVGSLFGSLAALYGRLTRVDRKLQQHSRDAAVAAMPLLSNRRGMRLKTGTLMLQAGSYLHALREFITPRAMRCLILARKALPAAQRVHRRREWPALTRLWRLSLRL